jgi:hypothetical protein
MRRLLVIAVIGVVVGAASGCGPAPKIWGTPSNPNNGVESPYYGTHQGGRVINESSVGSQNSDTFRGCALAPGHVSVTLEAWNDVVGVADEATVTITDGAGTTSAVLHPGETVASTYQLRAGDCFTTVVETEARHVPFTGCGPEFAGLGDPICEANPDFVWQWQGSGYVVRW